MKILKFWENKQMPIFNFIFFRLILLLATKMLQFVEIQKAWILTLFELIIVRNFFGFKYYCPPCRFVFWRWWKVELTLCCRKYNLYRKKGDLCSCFLVKLIKEWIKCRDWSNLLEVNWNEPVYWCNEWNGIAWSNSSK